MTEPEMHEFHLNDLWETESDNRRKYEAAREFVRYNGYPITILIVVFDDEFSHHYVWGHPGPADVAVAEAEVYKAWALEQHPLGLEGSLLLAEKGRLPLVHEKFWDNREG